MSARKWNTAPGASIKASRAARSARTNEVLNYDEGIQCALLIRPHQLPMAGSYDDEDSRETASGSSQLAGRQAQAREVQFALLGVPQIARVHYQHLGDGPQPHDDLACVIQAVHVRVAGSEIAVWLSVTCIVLDRQEQRLHGRIEIAWQKNARRRLRRARRRCWRGD